MSILRWSDQQLQDYNRRVFGIPSGPAPLVEVKTVRKRSEIEVLFLAAQVATDLPPMVEEFRPLTDRKFRIDFAYPERKIGVECDGAVHRIKDRFKRDIERHNLLTLAGWRIVRVGRDEIKSGKAIDWLRELLEKSHG